MLRLPDTHPRSLICFASRVRAVLLGSCLAASARAPGRSEGAFRARSIVQPTTPSVGLLSRGRERDLSGSQAIHPVPLPRSKTPAEPTIPRHWRFRRCCPRFFDSEGFSVRTISGLPRGFSTCCLRFTNGVATIHAKLASGWLAGLYREGVEPSGSRRKVSDFVLILLSWTFPDASRVGEDVATLTPRRPGCADFPLPVLHGRASLAAVYRWTIRAAGSG